jgi:hypothetical protein
MKLARVVDDYVGWKRSLGFRFTSAWKILKAFVREAGPIEMDDVGQEVVAAFLRGPRPPIRSSWHTKYFALAGLVRFALQRGLLSTSPLPFEVPKRPGREHHTAHVSDAHPAPLRRGTASQRGAGRDGR